MITGIWNDIFFHVGFRQAIRGFALPVYARLGLACLWFSVIFHATGNKGHAAELFAFSRPLFLMGGYVLCVCFGVMLITFVADVFLNGRFRGEYLKRQHRESGNALLRLFALLLPIGLLSFYMANLTHAGQGAGIFRFSIVIWLIYFGVGVCFAMANGIWNLRRMLTAKD